MEEFPLTYGLAPCQSLRICLILCGQSDRIQAVPKEVFCYTSR